MSAATWASILAECDRVEETMRLNGMPVSTARLQLTVRRSRPRNWDCVRINLGIGNRRSSVVGRCIGEPEDGVFVFDVYAKDVRKAADKAFDDGDLFTGGKS